MKRTWILLLVIVVFAASLRLYQLGTNPPATYGDELSFAWNAWNILKTGTDEYGTSFPILFRAFDDYKAPIPVYILVPLFHLFGMQTFVLRSVVVFFALGSIVFTYLIAKNLFSEKLALVTALLLTISPWHLHLSRGYFESMIALCFFLGGVYFFLASRQKRTYLSISAVFFALTLYSYLTPRMVLLLFIPFLFWWARSWVFTQKKPLVYFTLILLFCTFPLLKASLFDHGAARIEKLTQARDERITRAIVLARNSSEAPLILKKILHNKPLYWIREVGNDYVEQFSPQFLFLYGDSSLRYGIGNFGMLYLIELPFILVGLFSLLHKQRKNFMFLLAWLLIMPIPAALVGKPFAVRSLAIVPAFSLLTAFGIITFISLLKNSALRKISTYSLIGTFIISLSYYGLRYQFEYPSYGATWWGWENKAAIDLALREENKYQQIFLSNFYSGLDLAFAYYTQQDPLVYRKAKAEPVVLADGRHLIKLGKFYIGSLDIDEQRYAAQIIPVQSLYIARPEEMASEEMITAPDDHRVLFYVYRTDGMVLNSTK